MTAVGLTRLVRWLSLLIVLGCAGPSDVASAQKHEGTMIKSTRSYEKPGDDVLRKKLSPLEYEVTQRGATEPAFHNKYWNQHEAGLYVDVATGEPLFSSTDKFDSGTGWPSFSKPVEGERVIAHEDRSYGMVRTEVLSRAGRSHLGHVFDDGPGPTGLRYCINSAALRFVPVAKLAEEGYEAYLPLFGKKAEPVPTFARPAPNACTLDGPMKGCQATLETVILAGGCFWGMEELLRKIPGVMETEVGYEGGSSARPNYESVKTGATGHAESVRVVFDPAKLTFEELLEKWFFRMHDPTTPNRQGNDVGTQYRSAIFVTSPAQRETAKRVIERVTLAKKWPRPIVTQVVDAGPFTPAEDYHQDYLQKHPNGYTCHFLRD